MTSERWQRVKELFRSACERESSQRAAFLDEACAGDEALRQEVASLLAAQEPSDSFLVEPALEAVTAWRPESQVESLVGRSIGPYKVLHQIGHGGMGTVYLAVRADDQYRKRVAIKLVRRGMDSEGIVRRFLNERQILAGLDHPNIARLYDGGTTLHTRHVDVDGSFLVSVQLSAVSGQPYTGGMELPLNTGWVAGIACQIAAEKS